MNLFQKKQQKRKNKLGITIIQNKTYPVEAIRYTKDNADAIYKWTKGQVFEVIEPMTGNRYLQMNDLLKGPIKIDNGDFVVRKQGINNEFYVIKLEDFVMNYEYKDDEMRFI